MAHAIGRAGLPWASLAYSIPSCQRLWTKPVAARVPVRPARADRLLLKSLGKAGSSSCLLSIRNCLPLQTRKGAITNSGWRSTCSSHFRALQNHLSLHKPCSQTKRAADFHLLLFQTKRSPPLRGRMFWAMAHILGNAAA